MTDVRRRIFWVVLAIACSAGCRTAADDSPLAELERTLPIERAPQRPAREKLSPYVRRAIDTGAAGEKLRVLVDLSLQLDLFAFGERLQGQGADRQERRRLVVAALQRLATESQGSLQPLLDELRRAGAIDSYRGFSVVNRLLVTATPSAILELAERDEVADIVEETTRDALVLTGRPRLAPRSSPDTSWVLEAMGIDALWREGAEGQGVVVGIIDTGASAAHEQLRGNFRGGARSWYDPSARGTTPRDSRTGHGTSILSAAVGQNVEGRILGVAPRAEWIACAALPEGHYNNVALTECADWMLNIGQPDVLINAWLLPGQGCDRSLQRIIDAWRAAEMLPVFSAGNDGPSPQSDRSPANYAGLYPGGGSTLSVGGTDESGAAYAASSRGPGSCDGAIFPTLVAPAEDVVAAFPLTPTTYTLADGTSVAAGLVAGAAAILLQRHPHAGTTDLETALRSSAIDLGPAGPDNTFGHGRLYLPAASDSLTERLRRSAGEASDGDSATPAGSEPTDSRPPPAPRATQG